MHATERIDSRRALIVDPRFNGPDGIANGGYLAGLLASELGSAVAVDLRRPTPLGSLLEIQHGGSSVELCRFGEPLARAIVNERLISAPEPVGFDRARVARAQYLGAVDHPYPRCFVCGPQRAPHDGLRLFTGPVSRARVAGPWVAAPHFANRDGEIRPEYVGALLDCPGGWALVSLDERHRVPMLLGRLELAINTPLRVGTPYVVVGEATDDVGRKRWTRTAIYGPDEECCAVAHGLWILPQ